MRPIFGKRKIKMLGVNVFLLMLMSICVDINTDETIHLSKKSGFYENSFYLEIEGKRGCTFYYTLDGSKPDMTSQKYIQPILVEDASGKNNVYSMRQDISPDLYNFGGGEYHYASPAYPVDKCNVIRVAAYDREQKFLEEETAVYFVGFQEKSGYKDLLKISLVTEPDHLFDYEAGIYVMGKKYDEDVRRPEISDGDRSANYLQRGREWERAARIDLFDQNGGNVFSSDCGIRIHGGVTRAEPQKSFSIYAREEYGGERRLPYDLFKNGVGPHKFILSSEGNDNAVKVRDYAVQKAAVEAGLDVATMKMAPCVLFLNGEYWGVYYLTESYNASYIQDHYDVAESNVIMVKIGKEAIEVEEGKEEDVEYYDEMVEYICNHDMQEQEAYQRACEMLDIDSFVDYYALQIYIGNHDWPSNNIALWRSREKHALNDWADGRWRYMLFDTNHLSVYGDAAVDDLERTIDNDPVFASLIRNAEVEQKFRERIRQLENEIFSVENEEKIFNQWFDEMSEAVRKSDERFYDIKELEDIPHSINSIKEFLKMRPEYMETYMENCFEKQS